MTCEVPECHDGHVRVPVVREVVSGAYQPFFERVVNFETIRCGVCYERKKAAR